MKWLKMVMLSALLLVGCTGPLLLRGLLDKIEKAQN